MNRLQVFIASKPCGFLKETDMAELIRLDRLCPVLVRCGGRRFTCPAQDCAAMIRAIEKDGDYVRDVSFPVGSDERARAWVAPEALVTPLATLPQNFLKPRPTVNATPEPAFNEADCGGVFDGHQVTSDANPGL